MALTRRCASLPTHDLTLVGSGKLDLQLLFLKANVTSKLILQIKASAWCCTGAVWRTKHVHLL